MAKIAVHSKTEFDTKTVEETVVVKKQVTVPKVVGDMRVYAVQYRNYPETIHIQGEGEQRNRQYGFAFDIDGHSHDGHTRFLPSLAKTGQVYWPGSLVVNGTKATLVGVNNRVFDVPMHTLPEGV